MPRFSIDFEIRKLRLADPFTISRGTKRTVANVFIRLEAGGLTGLGEAAPNIRYDEDAAAVTRLLEYLPEHFFDDIVSPEGLAGKLGAAANRYRTEASMLAPRSALAAIEMAWLDRWGREQGEPLWRLWEAPSNTSPVTSFTIGLDEPGVMQRKTEAAVAAGYPVLKVKLGTDPDRDRAIVRAIREVTNRPLRVDANEGWKTADEARRAIDFLAGQNVELVEQPMPAARFDEMVRLKERSPLPLCADESFEGHEDPARIARAFHAVNIKLMKVGSLIRARRLIDAAREAGLEVMIGCMIESSLANAAGALLSLWADYADLDGHLLIADDPYRGLELDKRKHIILSTEAGLGVVRREDA